MLQPYTITVTQSLKALIARLSWTGREPPAPIGRDRPLPPEGVVVLRPDMLGREVRPVPPASLRKEPRRKAERGGGAESASPPGIDGRPPRANLADVKRLVAAATAMEPAALIGSDIPDPEHRLMHPLMVAWSQTPTAA